MSNGLVNPKASFGTMPVFLTALSTILGAILFLRFGWAVGQVGFYGVIGIIIIGHLVTIPTAMAVAEIATNQRVQGGGAYFIISRSFGLNIGAAVGLALYLSQAISVAFYVIAFGEAFEPVFTWIRENYGIVLTDRRIITVPLMAILSVLMLLRGANIGMKALYGVVVILLVSLGFFFFGDSPIKPEVINLSSRIPNGNSFFYVFTIIFPAFTGLAAGLGLSGDLKHPETSIPRGTIWATLAGLIVYFLAAYKFAVSASPEDLVGDQLIMQRIAAWGPIIPLGLAAASLSSALGSIMIAPRTLQAIGADDIFPQFKLNQWLARGKKADNEPINASTITIIIAFVFVFVGDVNFVAQIISMFFMITYGAICLISLLEHFAADPAYRPTFRSHWSISLVGTLASFWVMFKMNMPYAAFSLLIMTLTYVFITKSKHEKRGFNKLFRGVIFQLSRELQIFAQRADREDRELSWRPFAICISCDTFKRQSAFDFMRWISHRYGFGTYIHFIKGMLNRSTTAESKNALERLLKMAASFPNRVYLDTIISPSYTSAIAQVVQLSGISGRGNNLILFEFSRTTPHSITDAIQNYPMLESAGFDICILNTGYRGFGYKKEIHIWIKPEDYKNANLMILLGYITLGHPEWKRGFIKIFAIVPHAEMEEERDRLIRLIKQGRIPISQSNVEMIPLEEGENRKGIISRFSIDADLTIIGFKTDKLKEGVDLFDGYGDLGNILFVSSNQHKSIE
ncbi:Na-K-Cl cotransporter [Prolixibacter bellariivorans]|uniref:Na-K-Cl cotransporter n=1 Tax=Prolixibacter bellariivorans TaxID=314319 RepID=A0A5M4AWT8_9BACT|nr:amino acid permease [Prolixibacter bellariivorans]GET32128.1 Na-K-Cl cotransporter [Prolixibacter bellariivorans]